MMVNALLVSKIFVTYIHAQENIKSSIFSCCALPSLYVTLHFYNSILLRLFEYRALLISETIQNYYFYFIYIILLSYLPSTSGPTTTAETNSGLKGRQYYAEKEIDYNKNITAPLLEHLLNGIP